MQCNSMEIQLKQLLLLFFFFLLLFLFLFLLLLRFLGRLGRLTFTATTTTTLIVAVDNGERDVGTDIPTCDDAD